MADRMMYTGTKATSSPSAEATPSGCFLHTLDSALTFQSTHSLMLRRGRPHAHPHAMIYSKRPDAHGNASPISCLSAGTICGWAHSLRSRLPVASAVPMNHPCCCRRQHDTIPRQARADRPPGTDPFRISNRRVDLGGTGIFTCKSLPNSPAGSGRSYSYKHVRGGPPDVFLGGKWTTQGP